MGHFGGDTRKHHNTIHATKGEFIFLALFQQKKSAEKDGLGDSGAALTAGHFLCRPRK